jgi:hypothetical protein
VPLPRACVRTVNQHCMHDSFVTAQHRDRRMLHSGVARCSIVAASLGALERCQPGGNTNQQLSHRFTVFLRDPPFTPVEYRSLQHVLQRDTNLVKECSSFVGDLHRTTGQQQRCRRPAAHALYKGNAARDRPKRRARRSYAASCKPAPSSPAAIGLRNLRRSDTGMASTVKSVRRLAAANRLAKGQGQDRGGVPEPQLL